ncbi:MAG: hypothetical protein HZA61_01980 [Candidatus Eisenbacteria bacterium]|uniref:2'-5' RNA ligase family protein n=1 Tax=Eiseniibacteriota bacterium TaxID=2212470 RepID=A0A933W0R2_UNCEI|nr:hypothetical protein [Candidatus Eisenbacteria bacterium]
MTRRQLTLFVPRAEAAPIEALRSVLDPVQHALVAAHVTLCREDELASLADGVLEERLTAPGARAVTLAFSRAESFDGHGILLGAAAGLEDFHALRRHVLGRDGVRAHRPHLTLAHPRNPRAPGNDLALAHTLGDPLVVTFGTATLIEQQGGGPWRVLREWALA